MKCCNHNHDNSGERNNHKGHMSHIWMMLLCCGAPMLLLLLLPAIGSFVPRAGYLIGRLIPFLCPLMMIMMLPMMFGRNKCSKEQQNNEQQNNEQHNNDQNNNIEKQTE